MLIWPQVSLLSGTMRHSCVETRLHRNVHITLLLQQPRRGICLPRRTLFWNRTLWMVVSGKRHSALVIKLWEDQSWEEPEEAEVLDDDGTDELPPGRPRIGRSMWLPGSSGGLCSDGVQECFVGHQKRHANIHGGQGSFFSSKARKRLLPCGRSALGKVRTLE